MAILTDIIKFIFGILILFYIPGYLLVRALKKGLSALEGFVLSLSMGLFMIPHIYYHLENIRLHNLFLALVILGSSIYAIYKGGRFFLQGKAMRLTLNLKFDIEAIFLLIIILFILSAASLVMGTSGVVYNDGMRFYQANAYDSINQLAMVEELSKEPPHDFPFYSGLSFRGYYVGAFYWRALIQKVANINSVDLFFRYCPIFLLPLIVMMLYSAIKNVMKNRHVAILGTFFIFLMSDLAWVFPVVDRFMPARDIQTVSFTGSLLDWVIFNPPLAHAILIFSIGLYLLEYCDSGKAARRPLLILLVGMLFGSLFEYKAFVWATLFPGLAIISIKEYLLDKRSAVFKISLVAVIFSIISFFRISPPQTLSLFRFDLGHYPLSIFREMGILTPEGKANPFMVLIAFLFFLCGALGIKIVGFHRIGRYLKDWRRASPTVLLLILSMALSFILTHLLLLESNYPSATYNFFVIFLLGISVFSAEAVADWTRKSRLYLKAWIFSTIVIIGVVSTAFSFMAYLPFYTKYKLISKGELEAVGYIKRNIGSTAVILNNPTTRPWISQMDHGRSREDVSGRDSFISALTGRRTVIDCIWHMKIGNYAPDLAARQNDVSIFFKTKNNDEAGDILKKYNISYVWADKNEELNFSEKGLLEKVFSNDAITIYRVLL